jgi:predicted small lipoprotein YifL
MTLRFLVLLALASLACGMQVPAQMPASATQTPGNAPATITPTTQTFTVVSPVWVRTLDGAKVEAVSGGTFGGFCDKRWCYIIGTSNKIWRGCTDRADGRKCEGE